MILTNLKPNAEKSLAQINAFIEDSDGDSEKDFRRDSESIEFLDLSAVALVKEKHESAVRN